MLVEEQDIAVTEAWLLWDMCAHMLGVFSPAAQVLA